MGLIPPTPTPGKVEGLRCAEEGCIGVLQLWWSGVRHYYGCSKAMCSGSLPANVDGSPRGAPRTKRLQRARKEAHDVFDTLWKSGRLSRSQAYAWLRFQTGLSEAEAHMAQMTEEQCDQVISLVNAYTDEGEKDMEEESKWTILGEPKATAPTTGSIYDIKHSRKGNFRGRVVKTNGVWCTVQIVDGRANAVNDYNIRDDGEEVQLRDSLCTMTLVSA